MLGMCLNDDSPTGSSTEFCNLLYELTNRAADTDYDLDGVPFSADNCPDIPNPDQADADADSVGDVCDVFPSNPGESSDHDEDGTGDKSDEFPIAVTSETVPSLVPAGGDEDIIKLDTSPDNSFSSCTLTSMSAEPVNASLRGEFLADTQIVFTLNGCASGEAVQITLDFGVILSPGTSAYKIIDGKSMPIQGVSVSGTQISYTLVDNGPYDTDPTLGSIADPVAVKLPVSAVPLTPAWWLVIMAGLLSYFGVRRLRHI